MDAQTIIAAQCADLIRRPLRSHARDGHLTRGDVHEGEPLGVNAPERQPIPRKDPFGCEKKTKKKSRLPLILLVVILLSFLSPTFFPSFPVLPPISSLGFLGNTSQTTGTQVMP